MVDFKLSMFNLKKIKKHKSELITYDGHLPYLIMAVLSFDDVTKRYDYLKGISPERYSLEIDLLKSERKSEDLKIDSLAKFIEDNPKYEGFILED